MNHSRLFKEFLQIKIYHSPTNCALYLLRTLKIMILLPVLQPIAGLLLAAYTKVYLLYPIMLLLIGHSIPSTLFLFNLFNATENVCSNCLWDWFLSSRLCSQCYRNVRFGILSKCLWWHFWPKSLKFPCKSSPNILWLFGHLKNATNVTKVKGNVNFGIIGQPIILSSGHTYVD